MNSIQLDGNKVYPSKIICVGRNYAEHIEELNNKIPDEIVIFIKPNSSISDEVFFSIKDEIHYEAEISFLIKAGKIQAVAIGLDLTKRNIQAKLKSKGLPWERAKAFDHSAVFSQFISFDGDISQLRMELYINNKRVQQAFYELMLNKPDTLLNEISSFLSVEDNDLIMTGTPRGVGPIQLGDQLTGKIFLQNKLIIESCWTVK